MKVLLVNGGPHKNGCTYTALCEIARGLEEQGVESEIYFIENAPLRDCIGCLSCKKSGICVFDDCVNEFTAKAAKADGFVFASPVYYAHPTGKLLSFMDRAFYSGARHFAFKPAAAIFSARRAGSVASMDVVNKYFSIASMPIVSSTYWNHVFGKAPEDVLKDKEGMMTMFNLGKNMGWLIKCIAAAGIPHPENQKINTNFIK